MVERDLGQATIVYESADGDTTEKTVQNEHLAYFQDHWIIKTGEHDEGHDVVRRIPASRVYHVERSVEQFEEEVKTLRDQVQSVAEEVRNRFLSGEDRSTSQSEVRHIEVGDGDSDDDRNRGDESDRGESS